jgi:glutaredoxin 3
MNAVVTMYVTDWCPYCARARNLFAAKDVAIAEVNVDSAPAQRDEMQRRSGRNTVPQIFIGDQHIGGCDDLLALESTGRLDLLLKGVS